MELQVQVEEQGTYLRKVSVSVPQETVDKTFDAAMRKINKEAFLPGFRSGKIPKSIIERNFGAQMRTEVQQALVEQSVIEAMDTGGVDAVAIPTVTFGRLARGAPFDYVLTVEVQPDVALNQIKGLVVPALGVGVTDDDVQAHIERMRRDSAQMVPVLDRNVVQQGDVVLLDYVGTVDGQSFAGGALDNKLVHIKAGDYVAGFIEGIEGAEVPSKIEVAITFPSDYTIATLAGKNAIFAMTLKELKAYDLPTLDDELAKDLGAESLAALTTMVKARLTEQKKTEDEKSRHQALLTALIAANPFEAPPGMIDHQVEQLLERARQRVEARTGKKYNLDSQTTAELRGSLRPEAEFRIRVMILLKAVAKAEGITVANAALDAEIERHCAQFEGDPDDLRLYFKTPGNADDLRARMVEDLTLAHLLKHANTGSEAQ